MTKQTTRTIALAAVLLLGLLMAGAVAADHLPDPSIVTIVGSLQQELGCPGDWQETCTYTDLNEDIEDGVWRKTFNLAAGDYEYKVVLNHSWAENYGLHAESGGPNIPLTAPGSDLRFYYSRETHWVTDNVNSRIATAVGSFQGEIGCPGDWLPDCLLSWMQDPDGDGTYEFVTNAIPAGDYEAKAAMDEAWAESYPGGNVPFTVPNDGATVTFRFISSSNSFVVLAGHDLDNNVEYDGLAHNSHDTLYRVPFGAVTPGEEVILRLRTFHNDVESVRARVWDDVAGGQFFLDLDLVAAGVSCYDDALSTDTCDFWQATLTPAQPTTYYYRFIITDGTSTAHYEDDNQRDGGWGQAQPTAANDFGYVIQVYDPAFKPISWLQNGVMYQIFPDRFRNGKTSNDADVNAPRYGWPTNALDRIQRRPWNTLPEGYCRFYVNPATPCTESPRGRDYFGGDLAGVQSRLAYLKGLGVTVIYFNPVFDAASNHAYDTQDYFRIDPFFGTNAEFNQLIRLAGKSGIKIVVDGVFNHVSSDSRYFDRYGHFSDVGACESVSSPYRSWFFFFAEAGGPCAGPGGPNTMNYNAWFGFDSLPVLNKNEQAVQDLFYAAPNSVNQVWLDRGVAGWRLDVMGDGSFPVEFWREFRDAVKAENPQAPIIGELWKKFEILPKTRGDQADTAMGYRFRNAILGFFGTVDDKGFIDDGQSNQPPTLFASKLISIREDNADASYYTMMNILGSHDTQRILWLMTPGERNREQREFNAANLAQGKNLLELAAVVQMTTPGTPTIYYGDEIAMTGDDDPDDRRTFPWNGNQPGGDAAMLAHYKMLTQLRAKNKVFRLGELSFLLTDDANRTMAYMMRSSNEAAVVAVNRNGTPQTLVINALGHMPDAVNLTDVLGTLPGTITAVDGVITIELPALSAAVLLPVRGQDLVAPRPPQFLTATAGNGEVSLDWQAVRDAASYRVYRSPVTGGGYVLIDEVTSSDYVDTTAENGRDYFYVVRAVDAAGNEGAPCNEASATPFFPIGYTLIQWPPTLNFPVRTSGSDPVYGRVHVAGVTGVTDAGDPNLILAEVGYGPVGSNPAGWTTWWPMTHNPGCGAACGNNYEYEGRMFPETAGSYDYLVRFSTNNGQTWVYGDVDGWSPPQPPSNQYNDPGDMTVTPPSDTAAPDAPVVSVVSASPEGIGLSWTAVADTEFYEVLRSDTAGGPYTEIGQTNSPSFTDTNVVEDTTYYYVVRAVDASFNRSDDSNEVEATAARRTVTLTFNVTVPATTDATGRPVGIAGTLSGLDGGFPDWTPGAADFTRTDATHWTGTFTGLEGTQLAYKYVLDPQGNSVQWAFVEKDGACGELAGDRTLTLDYGLTGTQTVNDTVANWRNVAPCGN